MTDRPTMAEVSHAAGCIDDVCRAFGRGPERVALPDGGQRESADASEDQDRIRRRETAPEGTMKDVSHTPVYGTGANRVWHRGREATATGEKGVHDRDAELSKERVSARDDEHEPR